MYLLRIVSRKGEDGQALTESALLITLIAVVVAGIATVFGQSVETVYCRLTYRAFPEADLSSACESPIPTPLILAHDPTWITLEVDVYDPDGDQADPHAEIAKVEFYLDGTEGGPLFVDDKYHYCLGGGNRTCNSYNTTHLSPGQHRLLIFAYDSDGNVGRTSWTFRK